ncbi:MAG: hypothetical protein JO166_02670 [Deltaproteobacteria bacterium]|nr:hypothetical protein [Deltaproteobacteria bacterium]
MGLLTAVALVVCASGSVQSGSAQNSAKTLIKTAKARFGVLTDAEIRMLGAAPTRRLAWASTVEDPDDKVNDAAKAESWGKERTVRADLLAWLLSDSEASKLVHPSGVGLAAARIVGKLDLSYLEVVHPLTLLDCSIPEGIDFSYAQVNSIDLRRSWTGTIDGDQSLVHGDLDLWLGRYDSISLFRAQIGGNLDLRSSHLVGDPPLFAVQATINGDIVLHEGVTTGGLIDLSLIRIGQSLSVNDAQFTGDKKNGLNADRAIIGGTLYWVGISKTPNTVLDLSDAHATSLWDDEQSWPSPGHLYLDGFVYDGFAGGPADGVSRLRWLRLQPVALQAEPEPYRQLAQVLRHDGREEGAVQAQIARENARARYGGTTIPSWLWLETLRVTIGYGYRPLRALWWILGFVLLGALLFRWGYRAGLITPTEESAYHAFLASRVPPRHYPPFSSFVYSLENFLPVVDLHQGAYWRPNPHHRPNHRTREYKWVEDTILARLLRCYLWIHILAGWTITPLLFAGLAGLLRND